MLSLFVRSWKNLSKWFSEQRMSEKAEVDVEESVQAIQEYKRQVKELKAEQEEALEHSNDRWEEKTNPMTEIVVTPYKKDIQVELFGVAWLPYNLAQAGIQIFELEGFSGAVRS